MEVLVKLTVDRLGVPPDRVLQMIRSHLPEFLASDGLVVAVTDAKIERVVLPSR